MRVLTAAGDDAGYDSDGGYSSEGFEYDERPEEEGAAAAAAQPSGKHHDHRRGCQSLPQLSHSHDRRCQLRVSSLRVGCAFPPGRAPSPAPAAASGGCPACLGQHKPTCIVQNRGGPCACHTCPELAVLDLCCDTCDTWYTTAEVRRETFVGFGCCSLLGCCSLWLTGA